MKAWLPRRRTLLALHRWLGLVSAVFLACLALTGLALNHTERLQLDRIRVTHPFILSRYGMDSHDALAAFRVRKSGVLVHFRNQLLLDGRRVAETDKPVGLVDEGEFLVVVTPQHLVQLTPEGELIESLDTAALPTGEVNLVGTAPDGRPVLVGAKGAWRPDSEWLRFERYVGGHEVEPLPVVTLSSQETERIIGDFQGSGVSLYRVLLDLHSGRLFGWEGRTLMDLTAVAILALIVSGLTGWLRRSRTADNGGAG